MNKQQTIKYLKENSFDNANNVKEYGELSYEERKRVARVLIENGWEKGEYVAKAQDEEPADMRGFVSFEYLTFGYGDAKALQDMMDEIRKEEL